MITSCYFKCVKLVKCQTCNLVDGLTRNFLSICCSFLLIYLNQAIGQLSWLWLGSLYNKYILDSVCVEGKLCHPPLDWFPVSPVFTMLFKCCQRAACLRKNKALIYGTKEVRQPLRNQNQKKPCSVQFPDNSVTNEIPEKTLTC